MFINLGTNAGVTDPAIVHQVIQMLDPDGIIMLVTLYPTSDFVAGSDAWLKTIANQYAHVGLIDWNSYVANHPEWLKVDSTNPSVDGMMPYTGFVKDELNMFTTQLQEQQVKEQRRR